MDASSIRNADVLVVGAGPTGLVLALWLTRLGVRVRIIDKTSEPGTTSRALPCRQGGSVYGGVMRTVLARQDRMGPHGVGCAFLLRQTSMAVR
jgi:flavin-dependent dehydrogenase